MTTHDSARPQRPEPVRPLDVFLSIVALSALAVAQPLLDLLGRNAEFFLARATPRGDIVLLGLVIGIVIPAFLGVLVVGIGRVHAGVGQALHIAVITVLGAIMILQIAAHTPFARLPGWVEIALSAAGGLGISMAYYRSEPVRAVARFAGVAPLVVVSLFLFSSSTSRLVFAGDEIAEPYRVTVSNPAPVVMVVFDEFPVASIMDGEGAIDPAVYPGFARLAADGTWYRNAVTVQQQTENSLPAILSGIDPGIGKLPTAADHPFTLFTLLADAYELRVQEAVTDLCPAYACENSTRHVPPAAQRWKSLGEDLWIVAGHVFLPNDVAAGLARIDTTWANFNGGDADADIDITTRFQDLVYSSDRRAPIGRFIEDAARDGDEPTLVFLHALVPHVPWTYLPSGQTYPSPDVAPGSVSPGWGDDAWLVDQAYQQHLMQVGYVDTVVQRLIAALEGSGRYDDALIVVVADHGIAVRPGVAHRRVVTMDTIGDIAAVPLFIKLPGQRTGGADDYRAETTDILPTIADALGIHVPWATDGTSLIADDRPVREESRVEGSTGVVAFGTDGSEARAVAARKVDHFGGSDPYGLAPNGFGELLGREIGDLRVEAGGGLAVTLEGREAFRDVDLDGPELPAWVTGRLLTEIEDDHLPIIAIVVNGMVAAVTRATPADDGAFTYGAVVPPDVLVDGRNEIELALVDDDGTGRRLLRMHLLP